MTSHVVVLGVGELGALFARGALRCGRTVVPILRGDDPATVLKGLPQATPILVAVGESDFGTAMSSLPKDRRADAILVQNELFPSKWEPFVTDPTVAVVWTAAKPGIPLLIGKETVVYGQHAETLREFHRAVDVPCRVAGSRDELITELVAKFAFILTINVGGLVHDVTVESLAGDHAEFTLALLDDALTLGQKLAGEGVSVDHNAVREAFEEAAKGLGSMPARGRSAPQRLARAVALADEHGLSLTSVQEVAENE